jgi:hypothetical protein
MSGQLWSWILTAIGLAGFFLAGKKIWWAWYVNIANQAVWLAYSLITQQWGFLVGVVAYTIIFTKNAIAWTKDRPEGTSSTDIRVGEVVSMSFGPDGMTVVSKVDDTEAGHKVWNAVYRSRA